MPRLRARDLPHTVSIEHFAGDGAEGSTWAGAVADVPAYVEQKSKLIVDRRTSSPTANQEIVASNFIVLLTANDVLSESYITVWAGTPRERRAQVISSALFDYRGTPSHVEVWTD
jgi:hypothetical protein